MASGRTHAAVALIAAAVVPLAVYIYKPDWPLGPIVKGLLVGWLITPDVDIDDKTYEEERLENLPLIGPLLGYIWQVSWYPYARAIPHRSPLSHWPPLATFLRYLYLWGWAWIIMSCLGQNLPLAVDLWFLGAWAVQDLLHLAFDYL